MATLGHIVDSSTVRGFRCDEASGSLVDAGGAASIPEYGGAIAVGAGQVDGGRVFPTNVYASQHFFSNAGAAVAADFTKMQTQRWSLAAWVKPSYANWGSDVSHVIAASGHGTDDSHRFQGLLYYLQGGRDNRELRGLYEINTAGGGTGSSNLAVFDSLWALELSQWQYVCVVVDGVAGTATYFFNGQKGNVVTGLAAPTQGYLSAFTFVGANPSHLFQQWVGSLDEVWVWNRALSDAEVLENFHRGVGTPGYSVHRPHIPGLNTMRYWKCDEVPSTPGGHIGPLVDSAGGPTIPCNSARTGGQVGGAMLFAYGTGDAPCVQVTPYAPDRNRMLAGNVSACGWALLSTTDCAADALYNYSTLMALSNPGSYFGAIFRVAVRRSDWKLYHGYESGTPGGGVLTEMYGAVFPRDRRVHWAVCRTNGHVDMYLDGVLVNTFTGLATPSGGQAGSTWVVGAYANGIYDRWWGVMDETIIFDKYLSAAEVASIYQDGIGYPVAAVLPTITRSASPAFPARDLLLNGDDFARGSNGDLVLARGLEAVRQDIQLSLELIRGEYFLDTDRGTPWFDGILGKTVASGAIASLLRARIESRPFIQRVTRLELNQDTANRKLFVDFEAQTDFGDLNGLLTV